MRLSHCRFLAVQLVDFQVSFVVCTGSSIRGSTWTSHLVWEARLWSTNLSHILGSGLMKSPLSLLWFVFFGCFSRFYLLLA